MQWRAARAGRIDITDNILIAASLLLPDTATPGQQTALLVSRRRAQKSLFLQKSIVKNAWFMENEKGLFLHLQEIQTKQIM